MTLITAAPRKRTKQAAAVTLLTMSLGVLIAQIDTSVVNLAVKEIGVRLDAGVTALQWIVDAYNLVYASLLLTAGTLADLYGRRRVFALGIALFTLGSLVCGLAPNAAVLVAGRAVAGLGAALEIPTSLAILTVTYQETRQRTQALGLWASCNGLAFIVGPTLGGVLVESVGWRSIFLLIIPLCILALVLTATSVSESRDPIGRRLDAPGQALAIAALGTLSLAVIEGPRWGWESMNSVAAFVGSALSAVLFVLRQKGSPGALIPLAIFRNRVFSASLGIALAMTFGMYAMLFLTPLYLQAARSDSALQVAVELLPMSITFVIVSQLSGKVANAYGPRLPMTLGMTMMGVGLFMLALVPLSDSLLLIEAALFVIGCGLGLNTAPVNAVAVANVPAARSGTASGLLNTARMVGATLGIAVLGTMFAVFAGGRGDHIASGLPPAFIVGGIGEILGAGAAFAFIRRGSLPSAKTRL
jgi:MFS transporter, DHA2 family, methylenomycin A resistance protein